jgi:phosphoglycerol transferase
VALALVLALIVGTAFLRAYFGPVTPDQLAFHLRHGGLGYADPRLAMRAVRWGLGAVFMLGVAALLLACVGTRGRRIVWGVLGGWAAASVAATVTDPCRPGDAPAGADALEAHYVDPSRERFEAPPEAGRPDILVVYVESLDQSYAAPDAPQASPVPGLSRLQREGQTFGALRNLSGASWTVGGIFTSLCGLPLGRVGLMSTHALEYAPSFFRGGTCLTDVLAALGWEVSFHGGASLRFAGKGQFLADHGVARRFGREQWQAMGLPVPATGWGLLDTDLAEQAWRDISRPAGGGSARAPRMNLLLTVNTHGPSGAWDPTCAAEGGSPLDDDLDEAAEEAHSEPEDPASRTGVARMHHALRCTDAAVAKLVSRFLGQADGRPKVVWVMGDHLTPRPLQDVQLPPAAATRTVFHLLVRRDANGRIVPVPRAAAARTFTHADVMPTLAAAAGLRWGPHAPRLGVGVSLLDGSPTLAERVGFERLDGQLSCPSPLFERLWMGGAPGRPHVSFTFP